jgi:hypothetical protein
MFGKIVGVPGKRNLASGRRNSCSHFSSCVKTPCFRGSPARERLPSKRGMISISLSSYAKLRIRESHPAVRAYETPQDTGPSARTKSAPPRHSPASVARVGFEPTNNHGGLSSAALPRLRTAPHEASPAGLEPAISTVTGWRALRTAP